MNTVEKVAGSIGKDSWPAGRWAREEIAIDAFHHTIYAAATGLAYELLRSRSSDR